MEMRLPSFGQRKCYKVVPQKEPPFGEGIKDVKDREVSDLRVCCTLGEGGPRSIVEYMMVREKPPAQIHHLVSWTVTHTSSQVYLSITMPCSTSTCHIPFGSPGSSVWSDGKHIFWATRTPSCILACFPPGFIFIRDVRSASTE